MWPTIRVLPIGWFQSVFVGQKIHEKVLAGVSAIDAELKILPGSSSLVTKTQHGIYIDELFATGVSVSDVRRIVLGACRQCSEIGFSVAKGKQDLPPKEVMEILSIVFY